MPATVYQRASGRWSESPARRLLWATIQAHHRLTETAQHTPTIAAGETRIHRTLTKPVGAFPWKSWHAKLLRDHPDLLKPTGSQAAPASPVGKDDAGAMTSDSLAAGGLLAPDQRSGPKRRRRYDLVPIEKTAEREQGLFVGLWLTSDDAARLAVAGGEAPTDLHVTVIYSTAALSPAERQMAIATVNRWSRTATRAVAVAELSVFHVKDRGPVATDTQDVLIAVVPPADLDNARTALIERLRAAGIPLDMPHPKFKPHVTLAYIPATPHEPVGQPKLASVHFDEVVVGFGDQTVRAPLGQMLRLEKYSPDQERDDHGRWSAGGGDAGEQAILQHIATRTARGDPPALVKMTPEEFYQTGSRTGMSAGLVGLDGLAVSAPAGAVVSGMSGFVTRSGDIYANVLGGSHSRTLDAMGEWKGNDVRENAQNRERLGLVEIGTSGSSYGRMQAHGAEGYANIYGHPSDAQVRTVLAFGDTVEGQRGRFAWAVVNPTSISTVEGHDVRDLARRYGAAEKAEWVVRDEGDEYEPGDLDPDILRQIDVVAAELAKQTGEPLSAEVTKLRNEAVANVSAMRRLDLPQSSIDAAVARNFENVAGITDTTKNQLRDMLRDTLRAGRDYVPGQGLSGGGPQDFAQRLRSSWDQLSRDRANLIATTEYNTTASAATLDAYRQQDMPSKIWITVGDDLVCPECEDNAAVGEIGIDEVFPSGDDSPPAHPGCRCSVAGSMLDQTDQTDQTDEGDVTASVEGVRKGALLGGRFRRRDLAHERHTLGDRALTDQMITYKDDEPVEKYDESEARDEKGQWTCGDHQHSIKDRLGDGQLHETRALAEQSMEALRIQHPSASWRVVGRRMGQELGGGHRLGSGMMYTTEGLHPSRIRKYSDDEARDDHGRWTASGSGNEPFTDKTGLQHEFIFKPGDSSNYNTIIARPADPNVVVPHRAEFDTSVRPSATGELQWHKDKIEWVGVHPDFQRRGLATEMLRRARIVAPDLKHSDMLSPTGRAWSEVAKAWLDAVQKYDDSEARDDHGRWTADDAANDIEGRPFVDKKGVSHDFTFTQVKLPGGGSAQNVLSTRPSDPTVVLREDDETRRAMAAWGGPIAPIGSTGALTWYGNKIDSVAVHPDFRRSGLATEMLARARTITPGLTHDFRNLSADGRAWSAVAKAWMGSVEAEDNRLAVSDEIAKQMDLFGD